MVHQEITVCQWRCVDDRIQKVVAFFVVQNFESIHLFVPSCSICKMHVAVGNLRCSRICHTPSEFDKGAAAKQASVSVSPHMSQII